MLIVLAFIVAGGGIAVLVGNATHPKQAIAYGLGWQGLIGGFLKPRVNASYSALERCGGFELVTSPASRPSRSSRPPGGSPSSSRIRRQ